MASGNPDHRDGRSNASDAGRDAAKAAIRQAALDLAPEKISASIDRQAAKVAAKAAKHGETLERLVARLDTVDVWTRSEPGARRPRLSRDDIAAAAFRLADAEGISALSMRRLATDLDVGTMTLYHYVRTKDELLTLVVDAFLAEIIVPAGETLSADWRAAITDIAKKSRDGLRRHPWIFDITDDPKIGPNAMRHFDQSWQAVSTLNAPLDDKIDLITAVDEYVFGYCLHERNNLKDTANDAGMVGYLRRLLAEDHYPTLSTLVETHGLEHLWDRIHGNARDPDRFDRNLARLLNGFAATFPPNNPPADPPGVQ